MKVNARHRLLIMCISSLLLLASIYLAGILIPEEAYSPSFMNAGLAPCARHIFGTDSLGRDVFMRTLKALSISMSIGIAASVISALIALIVGIAAACGSKIIDSIIAWIIDLVMAIPHTVLVILISFSLGRGFKGILIGIAATHWCSLARLIRAEVMQLRAQQYILISRKLGKSHWWIIIHHMLPQLIPQFLVGLVLLLPHAILHEAAVSFLGFGLPPHHSVIL